LRTKIAKLAETLPTGSLQQRKLLKILASGLEDYRTEGGKRFRIRTKDFAQFLVGEYQIRPGLALGEYLRGEKQIPDSWLPYTKSYGGQFRESVRHRQVAPRGPDIYLLWEKLRDALQASTKGIGADAGDYFVNMPRGMGAEDFDQYLQGISGDVAQSFDYALSGKAEALYDKFVLALKTGLFTGGGYERWNLRERKQILSEIYADAWYDAMAQGWAKLRRNPSEMARLQSMRP